MGELALSRTPVILAPETAIYRESDVIEILYQDEHTVAVNKPSGWLVHRSWLDRHETRFMMQTVRDQLGQHVFTVHRLDRPTSGVLLMALSSEVARCCRSSSSSIRCRKPTMRWCAVTCRRGDPRLPAAELDKIADKHADADKGQAAVTHYRPLAQVEMPVAVGRYDSARYSWWSCSRKPAASTSCGATWRIFAIRSSATASTAICGRTAVWRSISAARA